MSEPEAKPAPPVIFLDAIHKIYHAGEVDVHAVRGVSLAVARGEFVAIMGASGSGKSTLMNLLGCLDRPTQGRYLLDGTGVSELNRKQLSSLRNRKLGFVFQSFNLLARTTALENVELPMFYSHQFLPLRRQKEKALAALAKVGLTDRAWHHPSQLSGGQQQRVALARALAPEPSLVLLDEPFSSLDAALRTSVRLDVARILGEAGTTTILVTHDQDEALSMADLVAVIRDGRIAQCAPPRELYARPVDSRVARFVGDANLIDGTIAGDTVSTLFGALPLCSPADGSPASAAARGLSAQLGQSGQPDQSGQSGHNVVVLIRPEQVELLPGSVDTGLRGVVADCDFHGHDATVRIDLAGVPHNSVVARLAADLVPESGTPVTMRVRGSVVVWPEAAAASAG